MTVEEGKSALAEFMAELIRTRAERDYYRRLVIELEARHGAVLTDRALEALDQESLPTG
jgi:hypothetical protein